MRPVAGGREKNERPFAIRQAAFQRVTVQPTPCSRSRQLRTDGNTILDVVKHVFRHHVLCDEFALHLVGSIAHNALGHILRNAQGEDEVCGWRLIDIQQGGCGCSCRRGASNGDGACADFVEDAPAPENGAAPPDDSIDDDKERDRSFISF